MKYSFAPLEGITGYIFRNTFAEFFCGVDAYMTPFLAPNQDGGLKSKEIRDILPENNRVPELIPQILTNHIPAFCRTATFLQEQGYEEVNLNLGCPSGTVVAKKKGAGLLGETELLERFLDGIFSGCTCKISVKTRIGKESPEEFPALLELFSRYPISELTIHPRIRTDFYNNQPNMDMFRYAVEHTDIPLCYNGDLCTSDDIKRLHTAFPQIQHVMLGRGLLADPFLLEETACTERERMERLYRYHTALLERYSEVLSGDRNILFKMKELWVYLGESFDGGEKHLKKIRKAQNLKSYRDAVEKLFSTI